MKNIDDFIKYLQENKNFLDARTESRLCDFLPPERWGEVGYEPGEKFNPEKFTPKEWTEENVIDQLKSDVAFGFEKALDQRGISASLMTEVVINWMWVLDGDFYNKINDPEMYAQYGLPVLKAVALKYGFDNPIGDDDGDEHKYSAEAYM